MNKTLRKAMLSTICMLVVAVVSLTGVTYAWFSQSTYAQVSNLNVQVQAAEGGVMIAGSSELSAPLANSYSNTIDLTNIKFGSDKKGVAPVSTIGGATGFSFFTANLVTPTEITTAADDGTNVFKYYLFLRNENSGEDMTINLGGNKNAEGQTQSNPTNITGDNDILKAARLGLRYVKTMNLSNEDLADGVGHVNAGDNKGYGIFSVEATQYKGVNNASGDAKFNRINDETYLTSVTPTEATDWDILVPQDSIVVVELLVWVEGQDANCINANANSTFDVSLILDKKPE